MLVLSRGANEGVKISDDIEVVVLEVKGDTVKLGFRAPREVRILRSEVAEKVTEQNTAAATAGVGHISAAQLPAPKK